MVEMYFRPTKMEILIYTGKKHFTVGKKSGKMTLPPQKKFPVTMITSLLYLITSGLSQLAKMKKGIPDMSLP